MNNITNIYLNHQELGLLLVLVAVAILTYSSLVYFAERELPVSTGSPSQLPKAILDLNKCVLSGASWGELHRVGWRLFFWQVQTFTNSNLKFYH